MFRSSGQNIQLEGVLCLPAAVLLFVYQGEWKEQLSSTGFLRRESAQNTMHLKLSMCVTVCVHRSEEDSEGNRDICSEILQMKALERLTSTVSVCLKITQIQNLLIKSKKSIVLTSSLQQVQSELAAALARKTRKACKYELWIMILWRCYMMIQRSHQWWLHALWLVAVSEQDSETTETSHQEPRTPSEESSPVMHTSKDLHIRTYWRVSV